MMVTINTEKQEIDVTVENGKIVLTVDAPNNVLQHRFTVEDDGYVSHTGASNEPKELTPPPEEPCDTSSS